MNPWVCRECSTDNGCQPLQRQGRCHPFPRYLDSGAKDEVPRVYTSFSPFTRQKSATVIYHHDSHEEYAKEYPICSATLSPPCFDLSRCSDTLDDGVLRVYSHGEIIDEYLEFAMKQHPDSVEIVHNASDACLSVVGIDSYDNPQNLLNSDHWNHGQNHYIFESGFLFGSHGNRPFNDKTQFGMAAVSPTSPDDAYIREGYDTPFTLFSQWKRPQGFGSLDIAWNRQYLMSFKGNIFPWE